ncbi:N-acetyldiaminopimelate deacetylase [Fictibacillus sp. KU28468]|uniref:N-acetyldiaminopimelate deacetylase n=1 Tax=Fictibacillus sp. KU28468 TaxID=2991053 RepID=UPI00223E0D6E|nr:N-acetyldiaminopimelate deacetylase [Fictibacillus sp. KU28468]UZJ81136.1 N-acetyldiaminopimelate deacetylase [Fictibacillus sp. KU28468]
MDTERFITIRRQLHQIPEPGFQEYKTQQFILDFIKGLPKERLEVQTWKTGVLVKVPGHNPRKTIGYRTDMDGLPISEETSYDFTSVHNGYMHACGHDLHMTIALGLLDHFVHHPVDDHLLFIFQPAEEGPGGALPLLQSEEFQAVKPDMMLALHIAPEYPVGTVAVKEGLLFANTSELFIDLKGKGGHAAYPHLANDMVVAASHLVTQLQSVVSRNIDPLDSAVITVGKITGGTKQNIIAETARLEGTIRTLSSASMIKVKSRIEAIIKGIEASFECEAAIDYGSNYYQVYNHEELTKEFISFLESSKPADFYRCREAMTGEDFGYFLKEIPGFMFWLGVDCEYGLHHSCIEPKEEAIPVALRTLSSYIEWKATSQ